MGRGYNYEKPRSRMAQERLDRMTFYALLVFGALLVAAVVAVVMLR